VSCPRCGRPGLPPEQVRFRKTASRPIVRQSSIGDNPSLSIDGSLKQPAPLIRSTRDGKKKSQASSAPRLIVSSGLLASAFLLLVAYLDRSRQSMLVFGTLTIVFFLILVRMRLSGRD
jgi:hypothetical protein